MGTPKESSPPTSGRRFVTLLAVGALMTVIVVTAGSGPLVDGDAPGVLDGDSARARDHGAEPALQDGDRDEYPCGSKVLPWRHGCAETWSWDRVRRAVGTAQTSRAWESPGDRQDPRSTGGDGPSRSVHVRLEVTRPVKLEVFPGTMGYRAPVLLEETDGGTFEATVPAETASRGFRVAVQNSIGLARDEEAPDRAVLSTWHLAIGPR